MRYVITHAAFAPERRESLVRMRERLPRQGDAVTVLRSDVREHPAQWAQRLWQWVAWQDEPVVCLEDDVILPDGFHEMCEAVLRASGGKACVSLHLQAPGTVDVQFQRWCRSYWLSTVACIMTPDDARSLVEYSCALPWNVLARMNHDNIAIWWAWERQQPFLATIPGLCKHNSAIPSTFGYDKHPNRVPHVGLWAQEGMRPTDPDWWGAVPGCPPHVNNPWAQPHVLESIRRALQGGGLCLACACRPARVGTQTGMRLCAQCLHTMAGAAMGLVLGGEV